MRQRRFGKWRRNENYDPEHLRAYREARPEDDDLPDDLVVQTAYFQWFALGEAARSLWTEIKKVGPNTPRR